MTTVELFLKLSIPEKDSFCETLVELGLISEMNPAAWNKTIKQLIKQSKGTLKKLYQSFRPLTPNQRAQFFQALIDEAKAQAEKPHE
jgi:hypothetical protein